MAGLGGCSSAYESYMADACDGLRTMATAYETRDRDAFDEGYTDVSALDPAGEEAAGDKTLRREVHRLWNAQRLLHIAAYEPAELNDGASIWRGDPNRTMATARLGRRGGSSVRPGPCLAALTESDPGWSSGVSR